MSPPNSLVLRLASTIWPAEPARAETPTIAIERGRITASTAATSQRVAIVYGPFLGLLSAMLTLYPVADKVQAEGSALAEEVVTYDCDGTIALIGLNRAAKRNALNPALTNQLRDAALRAHDEAKVGLIYSHGADFCAGLDLVEAATWLNDPAERAKRRRRRFERAFDEIARGPIPFVAAI